MFVGPLILVAGSDMLVDPLILVAGSDMLVDPAMLLALILLLMCFRNS